MPTPPADEAALRAAALDRLRRGANPFANQVVAVGTAEESVLAHVPEFVTGQLAELLDIIGLYRAGKGTTRVYPLLGERGSGKTHLLYCLREELRRRAAESGDETLVVVVERLSPGMDAIDYLLWQIVNHLIAARGDGARLLGVIAGRLTARVLGEALRGLSPPRRLELIPTTGFFARLGFGSQARAQTHLAAIDTLVQRCDAKHPTADGLREACAAAGVAPATALQAVRRHLEGTESKDVVGWFRKELYVRLAKLALLGDRGEFDDLHTGDFESAPANVKNAGNLNRRLLDAWLELLAALAVPVVVVFDQLEDYLSHHDPEQQKANSQFFTDSAARFINELLRVCILVFAEEGMWVQLVDRTAGFAKERLTQPFALEGGPAKTALHMPGKVAPDVLDRVIRRRVAARFADLDLTGLPPAFPFEPADMAKLKEETTLRSCLRQLARRYDEIVHKPVAGEPKPAPPAPRSELRQRLAELWKEKLAVAAKEIGSERPIRTTFIPAVQNALAGWFEALAAAKLTGSGPWHKVELVTDTKKGQYGYLTVLRTDGPNAQGVGIAAWLGEGSARPHDLRQRVGFFKQNPCPIKTLILLRADGKAALGGESAAEYEKARKAGRDVRVHQYEPRHLHALLAFTPWHQAAVAEVQAAKEADAAAEMVLQHYLADLSKEVVGWVDGWRQPVPTLLSESRSPA